MLTLMQETTCRFLLERAAEKHDSPEFTERCERAADLIHPSGFGTDPVGPTHHYPRFFRQGQNPAAPGHIRYWITSSETYRENPTDKDHEAPPYYRVRLGANGDNHGCTCPDFGKSAPAINGKTYCKHVIAARALEYIRDHPDPLGPPALLMKTINNDPAAEREFRKYPDRFVAAITAAANA